MANRTKKGFGAEEGKYLGTGIGPGEFRGESDNREGSVFFGGGHHRRHGFCNCERECGTEQEEDDGVCVQIGPIYLKIKV